MVAGWELVSSRHGQPWGKITEAWTWKRRRREMRRDFNIIVFKDYW